jgi:hypothetical protein
MINVKSDSGALGGYIVAAVCDRRLDALTTSVGVHRPPLQKQDGAERKAP